MTQKKLVFALCVFELVLILFAPNASSDHLDILNQLQPMTKEEMANALSQANPYLRGDVTAPQFSTLAEQVKQDPSVLDTLSPLELGPFLNINDAQGMLRYLFVSGPSPVPGSAGDVNHDSALDISDPLRLLRFLFMGGPPPGDSWPLRVEFDGPEQYLPFYTWLSIFYANLSNQPPEEPVQEWRTLIDFHGRDIEPLSRITIEDLQSLDSLDTKDSFPFPEGEAPADLGGGGAINDLAADLREFFAEGSRQLKNVPYSWPVPVYLPSWINDLDCAKIEPHQQYARINIYVYVANRGDGGPTDAANLALLAAKLTQRGVGNTRLFFYRSGQTETAGVNGYLLANVLSNKIFEIMNLECPGWTAGRVEDNSMPVQVRIKILGHSNGGIVTAWTVKEATRQPPTGSEKAEWMCFKWEGVMVGAPLSGLPHSWLVSGSALSKDIMKGQPGLSPIDNPNMCKLKCAIENWDVTGLEHLKVGSQLGQTILELAQSCPVGKNVEESTVNFTVGHNWAFAAYLLSDSSATDGACSFLPPLNEEDDCYPKEPTAQ